MNEPHEPTPVEYASPVVRGRAISTDRLVLGLLAATCLMLFGFAAVIGVGIAWLN